MLDRGHRPMPGDPGRRIAHGIVVAVLLGITVAVYLQVAHHPFIDLDDGDYVVANPHVKAGVTWTGFRWAFAATKASNWHPLTWISHQVDVELFGLSPGMHHVTNLLLHLVNTTILYSVFAAMTGSRWRSAFVAAVFALHPLHVESVAWISERKDLLSTLFGLLTVLAYVRYTRKPTLPAYLAVPFLFTMALLSKPMLVSLPFVLLLLDYWPLDRTAVKPGPRSDAGDARTAALAWNRLLIEKLPLFALSVASSVITYAVQERSGSVASADVVPFAARAANAVAAYASYVVKTAFPYSLAVFYPHPGLGIPAWTVASSAAFLALATGVAVRFRRARPALATGWFWYLGTLVPVIGLVQVGLQGMADRYTYLPQTGLVIMIMFGNFPGDRQRAVRAVSVSAASALLVAMAVACWFQVRLWRSDEALFSHALRHTKNNYLAYGVLGKSAFVAGRPDEAIRDLRESLRIRPLYALGRYNLGVIYGAMGQTGEAILQYRESLRIRPNYPDAWTNLGDMYFRRGQLDDAIRCCREALRLNPDDPLAHNTIGVVLSRLGMRAEAVRHFRDALRLDPGCAMAAQNLRETVGF